MNRCNVPNIATKRLCTSSRPCPDHEPTAYRDQHGAAGELYAIGGVDGDNDTTEICMGPFTFDVKRLREDGNTPEMIARLWLDVSAAYRSWEMRELAAPQWAAYHYVDHWFINGADRDQGRRGFFTDDVRLAQRFDSPGEAVDWIAECDLMHPEHPRNHERAGFTILRIR